MCLLGRGVVYVEESHLMLSVHVCKSVLFSRF